MPSRNDPLTETGIVAELRRRSFRHGGALAAIQIPQPAKDTLTITTSGSPATWTLSALPYNATYGSSVNLSLNGAELKEGSDYTVDYSTGIVSFPSGTQALFKATPTPADVVTADYWTTGDLIAATVTPNSGVLIPIGHTWKYQTGLGYVPGTYAPTAFNDSAWPSGPSAFGWGGSYTPGTVVPSPMNVWTRTTVTTDASSLLIESQNVDNRSVIYINGTLIFDWSSGSGSYNSGTATVTPGSLTFACYGSDDGISGGLLGIKVTEQF